jgi:hypothetical protein
MKNLLTLINSDTRSHLRDNPVSEEESLIQFLLQLRSRIHGESDSEYKGINVFQHKDDITTIVQSVNHKINYADNLNGLSRSIYGRNTDCADLAIVSDKPNLKQLVFTNYNGDSSLIGLKSFDNVDIASVIKTITVVPKYDGVFDLFQLIQFSTQRLKFIIKEHIRPLTITNGGYVINNYDRLRKTNLWKVKIPACCMLIRFDQDHVTMNLYEIESNRCTQFNRGNVFDGGKVCNGGVKIPALADFIDRKYKLNLDLAMLGYYELFFGSGFNGDLLRKDFDYYDQNNNVLTRDKMKELEIAINNGTISGVYHEEESPHYDIDDDDDDDYDEDQEYVDDDDDDDVPDDDD